MTDKISDAVIDEMLAGLEGVTPGPWEVVGSSLTDFGREWEASLSMEFIPNGREDGINSRADNDLAHLARCDPDTIRSLLIELRAYRTASNPLQSVLDRFAGVKVKPLEWEDIKSAREDGPAEPTGDIEALTLIGEYSVCFDGDDAVSETPWCAWSPVENIGHFADFEEAKAAAQADYERRILSALEATPAPVSEITEASRDVLSERQRQMSAEGWTTKHDDAHTNGELAAAAGCYALGDKLEMREVDGPGTIVAPVQWPWFGCWWKPKTHRQDLVRAGALIIAEIERLDRTAAMGGE